MSYIPRATSFVFGTAGINEQLLEKGCVATLCLHCDVAKLGQPTGESSFVDLHLTKQQIELLINNAQQALKEFGKEVE